MALKRWWLIAVCVFAPISGCSTQAMSLKESVTAPPRLTSTHALSPGLMPSDTVERAANTPRRVVIPARPPVPPFWQSVRSQWGLVGQFDTALINDEVQWLKRHPGYIRNSLKRGEAFLPHVLQVTRDAGLPSETILIPALESSYTPSLNGGHGPTGLWQITGGTAGVLGLRRNALYDGRRDIVDSTAAATRYLQLLGKQFDGNWLLAVAAYNAGPGTVSRAVPKPYGTKTLSDIERSRLPAHTKSYLRRWLALSTVIHHLDDSDLPRVNPHARLSVVEFSRALPLHQIADTAGIAPSDLVPFNTGLLQSRLHAATPQRIVVRSDVAWKIAAVDWQRYQPDTSIAAASGKHTVATGDTLSAIARRYGTRVETLQALNGLRGSLLMPGQVLKLPAVSASKSAGRRASSL